MKSWFLKIRVALVPPLIVILPLVALAGEPSQAATSRLVSGMAPHQRPSGAPAIREFVPSADWRARSLTGISEPAPVSLGFLGHQGAWYTPFNRPGMPGYYDLRNWHQGARKSTPSEPKPSKPTTP